MNETMRIIDQRRSTRAFAEQPVEPEVKQQILQAAYRAPTAGNMMLYSIIDVQKQDIKDKLVETCDGQPFIAKSPLVLVFLADYQRWWDYYHLCGAPQRANELNRSQRSPNVGDLMLACCDALIAAQTAVIAAESLGVQSCYIGDIMENYEIHRELFHLPRYVFPIAMLCFGYPKRANETYTRVPRFDAQYITFKDSYLQLDNEKLTEMFAPYEQNLKTKGQPVPGAQNFGQHNYLRKFTAEFSFEMNRSVAQIIKNWQSN